MEQQKLSETANQRVAYFQNGADKDGFEIGNQIHLLMAFEFVAFAVRKDLGNEADTYLDAEVMPYFREIARKIIVES